MRMESQTVDRMRLGATPVVRRALLAGEIDLYVEYTGNAGFFFNMPDDPAWKDLRQGYELGARLDYAANHIVWLTPANANNTWALAVRRDVAAANHLRDDERFRRAGCRGGGEVVLACSAEFANAGTLRFAREHLRLQVALGPDDRARRRRNLGHDRAPRPRARTAPTPRWSTAPTAASSPPIS